MDSREESSRFGSLPNVTLRNLSSASSASAFFSANQSPFFSPRSPAHPLSLHPNNPPSDPKNPKNHRNFDDDGASPSSYYIENPRKTFKKPTTSYQLPPPQTSFFANRIRNCDVYIGFHGRKPLLLRFTNWLRAELESQGLSCFVTDRSRCRNSRKQTAIEKSMDSCCFGVVILTKKSFKNPYSIEELRFFSSKKNLVPIYFDLSPEDCLVRDIVERRGELWEKHGGELWLHYGGIEREWKEAFRCLGRFDELKLEAREGLWRNCVLRAVSLLALKLGRRSIVDRITNCREKAERMEFPFPRNENFVGRKRELSELEFMLFGDVGVGSERDYFELKARPKPKRKNLTIGWGRSVSLVEEKRRERNGGTNRRKGKEPVIWKESEKEIEMEQNTTETFPMKYKRRKRSPKIVYGKGIACISGESGIGKTELLLEFAYRFHQRYKMMLWIGGESRYIRQNYLNMWSFLEVDVGIENCLEKTRTRSFEEQEEAAIARVRKELMRNIPFLVIIDDLESEKDWWGHKLIMDLLPRFGGETHVIISTRLSRVMNLEPLKLSYLSGIEAMSLMQGNLKDYSVSEIEALRVIEEKLGRLTLGLAIVGAILSELPINPSRLLDTINRMPSRDVGSSRQKENVFLLQLFEVCFSIFDHADRRMNLATRMVLASGWFAPSPIPVPLLAAAAHKIPEKRKQKRFFQKVFRSFCGFSSSYNRKSESEAASLLLRFNIARSCTDQSSVQFNQLIRVYARKRGVKGSAQAMVHTIVSRGSITHHPEHIWTACFLIFGFGNDPIVVDLKIADLLFLVKELILPLAIRTFVVFSRCAAALELLRLCTNALEASDQALVTPVEKWLDRSICWRPIQTNAQLNPCLWQELALTRATVLEIRAKLMLKGGQFDIADDLIRKTIFIRSSINGQDHPDTVSAQETLSKITRLLANLQVHTSPFADTNYETYAENTIKKGSYSDLDSAFKNDGGRDFEFFGRLF